MRPLLSVVLCGAIGAPGVALAQDIPDLAQLPPPSAQPSQTPALSPLPAVAPTAPAPAPITAAPPPTAEAGPPAPELAPPEKVAPVIVAKEDKGGAAGKVGQIAVGVGAGAAGAAVAGPVGKFAGGFIGRRIAQGLFGKKDKTPELTVTPQTTPPTGAAVSAAEMAAANQAAAAKSASAKAASAKDGRKRTVVADER
jgi:hypothetical protein